MLRRGEEGGCLQGAETSMERKREEVCRGKDARGGGGGEVGSQEIKRQQGNGWSEGC